MAPSARARAPVSLARTYLDLFRRNGALTRLLAGEFISGIGDWLYLVAVLVVVYAESNSPVLLGIVGAARPAQASESGSSTRASRTTIPA